jgi:predicted RND superfamily exporter protein
MNNYFKAIDRFAAELTQKVIAHRRLVLALALMLALGAGFGASKLEFSTNYRVFFSDANPELLDAVERLTAEAWKIPYAIRVDSVTNFQHSHASDDDLIVEDLVKHARGRDASYLDEREAVALAEPLLRNQLLTPDGTVTAVNVVLQYPQKHLMEVPEAVAFARNLATGIEADFTAIEVHLTGVSMLNNAFAETGMQDGATLMPLMFVVIFALTWLVVRSFTATFATLGVIMLSTMVGMGVAGWAGVAQRHGKNDGADRGGAD